MDTATLQILTMGAIGIAFCGLINWLERREKKQSDVDC
jgi:hypothetical protein